MSLLDRLERRLGRFAVPNVTLFLVALQGLCYVLLMAMPAHPGDDANGVGAVIERLFLVPAKVAHGEVWRLVTFLFVPPFDNPLFAFFALYFLYLMGTALEGYWGTFRYNVYLLIAWLTTIAAACDTPHVAAGNGFIGGSVFLAFAFLYPEFIIYIFFVIPVRIKWIALIAWAGYALVLIFGTWTARALVLASLLNFLLFFGRRLALRARYGAKHMSRQAQRLAHQNDAFHTCAACGITDKTHPTMEFRYCPDCDGTPGYCIDHIHQHEHRRKAPPAAQGG